MQATVVKMNLSDLVVAEEFNELFGLRVLIVDVVHPQLDIDRVSEVAHHRHEAVQVDSCLYEEAHRVENASYPHFTAR